MRWGGVGGESGVGWGGGVEVRQIPNLLTFLIYTLVSGK